jgi:prepilin-type N-terminal cleavage/methylation domain-containing protein
MLVKRQKQSESGFTLIEVLIVIAIIGVIAAIAMPRFNSWKQGADLNANARRLYGFFQQARMEAVKLNETCTVVLTATTYESKVGADVVHSNSYSNGITGTAMTRSYNSRGLINNNATVTLTSPDARTRDLVLNIRGRMRIE